MKRHHALLPETAGVMALQRSIPSLALSEAEGQRRDATKPRYITEDGSIGAKQSLSWRNTEIASPSLRLRAAASALLRNFSLCHSERSEESRPRMG
jgi:hypothetical protein